MSGRSLGAATSGGGALATGRSPWRTCGWIALCLTVAPIGCRQSEAPPEEQHYFSVLERAHRDGLPVWLELHTDESAVLSLQSADTTGMAGLLRETVEEERAGPYTARIDALLESLVEALERPCGSGAADRAALPRILSQLAGSRWHSEVAGAFGPLIGGERAMDPCRGG